ncbi:phage tail assembly chaperone [Roseovarius sp. SCSIO 43702]|uniref:rcc01693 family protein n=1 Tax=Roseovarius sp. SCSIO 43702 TaxID=2823043 RepID=UPI001C733C2B|nr:rcc01693 family protein [Roseovarius sp. SCSIO 43702]QYX56707.1 phage tail assembly chaperone [Roseovarius sp. SCSIO 43702]
MTPLDWAGLMRAGHIRLGLQPAEFWALTPAELSLMLGHGGPAPMASDRLRELMDAYPDQTERSENG